MNELHTLFSSIDPAIYAEISIIPQLACNNLLARLDFIKLQPSTIIDIGCGTGYGTTRLKERYPDATVFAVDNAESMLRYQQQRIRQQQLTVEEQIERRNRAKLICAKAEMLPFKTHSVDLIFANLLLPWCAHSWQSLFAEWQRILRPEGLLVFSSLGPDTLRPLQALTLIHRRDMHDMGDDLVHAQFSDPVIDTDYATLTYRNQEKWKYELQMNGIVAPDTRLEENSSADIFSATYEIIYGHTWGTPLRSAHASAEIGVAKFPLEHLRGRKSLI